MHVVEDPRVIEGSSTNRTRLARPRRSNRMEPSHFFQLPMSGTGMPGMIQVPSQSWKAEVGKIGENIVDGHQGELAPFLKLVVHCSFTLLSSPFLYGWPSPQTYSQAS